MYAGDTLMQIQIQATLFVEKVCDTCESIERVVSRGGQYLKYVF